MKLLISALIILFLVSIFFFLQKDEPLLPEVKEWLSDNTETPQTKDNAYVYLMGLASNENIDPFEYGLRKIEYYKNNSLGKPINKNTSENELEIPTSTLLCDKREKTCIETILNNTNKILPLLENNKEILNRYKTFSKLSEYKTLSKPNLEEIIPSYSPLGTGLKLLHLQVIQSALDHNYSQSIATIENNILELRKFLKIADNLIFKMILTAFITQDLELLSQLFSNGVIPKNAYISETGFLDDLNIKERSLHLSMRHELAIMVDTVNNLDKHPEVFEEGGSAPAWVVRLLIKPNKSINSMHVNHKYIAETSELLPSQLEANLRIYADGFNINLTNLVGQILVDIAEPNFDEYIGRVHDIQCKTRLIKLKIQDPINFEKNALKMKENSNFSNPYYGTTPYKDEVNNLICFNGPFEDTRNSRCTAI
ncbi:MAG: hypothetical protein ACR2PU_01625 [Gammaproteobacteria bacterium]